MDHSDSMPLSRRMLRPSAVALAALLIAGCAVGPDYVRPSMDVPTAFKETGPWKTATPQLIDAAHPWWEAYGDATLSGLIVQANAANYNVRVAEAQYRQASRSPRRPAPTISPRSA